MQTVHGIQLNDSTPNAGWTSTLGAADVNIKSSSITIPVSTVAKSTKTVILNVSANTQLVALVNGKRIKVTAYLIQTAYSAGTIAPTFTDGNGGATLWQFLLQAISGSTSGANIAKSEPAFIFGTSAGVALYFNPNGQACTVSVSYFDDDAT